MKLIRWIMASVERDRLGWHIIGMENQYAFILACGDKYRIIRHRAALDVARAKLKALTWRNI